MSNALVPNDSRVEHRFISIGEFTYYYMLAKPEGKPAATAVLIHGWPDLSLGWRYQVPYLVSLGLQVIVPDMLGYGQTSSPEAPEHYTMKKMTAHVAVLIEATTTQSVILVGHDWGAFFAWRMAMYYPKLVRAIASFCVPYMPPWPEVVTLDQLCKRMPNFSYQAYLASGAVEAAIGTSPQMLAAFLHGNLGGTTPEGEPIFSPEQGIVVDRLTKVRNTVLATPDVMEHYVSQYQKHGLRGPCNWYRTQELNSRDELPIAGMFAPGQGRFSMPAMIVMAENDPVLPPSLLEGQEIFFEAGLKKEVIAGSSHWVMIHKPEEVNRHLSDFVKSVLREG